MPLPVCPRWRWWLSRSLGFWWPRRLNSGASTWTSCRRSISSPLGSREDPVFGLWEAEGPCFGKKDPKKTKEAFDKGHHVLSILSMFFGDFGWVPYFKKIWIEAYWSQKVQFALQLDWDLKSAENFLGTALELPTSAQFLWLVVGRHQFVYDSKSKAQWETVFFVEEFFGSSAHCNLIRFPTSPKRGSDTGSWDARHGGCCGVSLKWGNEKILNKWKRYFIIFLVSNKVIAILLFLFGQSHMIEHGLKQF